MLVTLNNVANCFTRQFLQPQSHQALKLCNSTAPHPRLQQTTSHNAPQHAFNKLRAMRYIGIEQRL